MIRCLSGKITNSSQSSENGPPSADGARRKVSSRRSFLKGFGTAALVGAVPLATGLVRLQVAGAASGSPPLNIDARPREALRKRIDAAAMDKRFACHRTITTGTRRATKMASPITPRASRITSLARWTRASMRLIKPRWRPENPPILTISQWAATYHW